MSTTSCDALKEEIARRLEAMKTTWRLIELIGVQDAADFRKVTEESGNSTDCPDQRREVITKSRQK